MKENELLQAREVKPAVNRMNGPKWRIQEG